ncbi:MAG: hydrogenase maturation nickel metallochaperone HypA [Acidimicrobiia bacterium]|nr:hydrogenase maturation nickel metallochaperone HypA [Acidimicrobiia bacterium]
MGTPTLVETLLAQAEGHLRGPRATRIHIRVGALSNISPASLLRRFTDAVAGTPFDGAELVFHIDTDPLSADALRVRVVGVDRFT